MQRSIAVGVLGAALFFIAHQHGLLAQTPPAASGPVDPTLIEDLITANRILSDQGVLDGLGHVSIRHPGNPNRMLMSRSIAPALTTPADILEYDLDCTPSDPRGRTSFLERFIHCEIYKMRPDVNAVIHSHSPSVIPFSVTKVPMKAIFHSAGFLADGVPVFEIREHGGMTDMLVRNANLGKALAQTLDDKPVVLMRGHGDVVPQRGSHHFRPARSSMGLVRLPTPRAK